jgi:predicted P-type ATPase
LLILGVVAFIAFLDRFIDNALKGKPVIDTIMNSLDIVTIAVPPALPLILTVGIGFSVQRLKKKGIFCINPDRLNHSGRIDTVCWDKTGTLTVPNLRFVGTHQGRFSNDLDFSKRNIVGNPRSIERLMLACHGISKPDRDLIGHGLDVETFTRTGFDISPLHHTDLIFKGAPLPILCSIVGGELENPLYIAKRYEFCSYLQTSSTISFIPEDDSLFVYTKGSPEAIKKLCIDLIPNDFDQTCTKYAMEGYYVIACAVKILKTAIPIDDLLRKDVEVGLTFVGLLIFENPLKSEALTTIETLSNANIRSVIITGDNIYTAINVSKQLRLITSAMMIDFENGRLVLSTFSNGEIIPNNMVEDLNHVILGNRENELCITSSALIHLQESDPKLLNKIMPKLRIFARTKPDQKTWIVEWLIKNGSTVGMCGDGTNDCGALKAANVGIALSSAEASIIAPFTSSKKCVSDMVELIREGRCALETSYSGFKYMMLYPLIQLMIAATLTKFGTALANNQYLFDDIFIVTTLALFSLYTNPASKLTKVRPTDSLFSFEILYSIISQLLLCILFFAINIAVAVRQNWYCPTTEATKFLDELYFPIDASLGDLNYPCYRYPVIKI